MKTPEQIADAVLTDIGFPDDENNGWIEWRRSSTVNVIAAAIEADRAQRRYDVGKITLHWTCAGHDTPEYAEQPLVDIEDAGTAICPECGDDMELDSTVTVR